MKLSQFKQRLQEAVKQLKEEILSESKDKGKGKVKFDYTSIFEKTITDLFQEKDLPKAKTTILDKVESANIPEETKKQMKTRIEACKTKGALDQYLSNSLLKYEKMGVNENAPEKKPAAPERETTTVDPDTETEKKPKRRDIKIPKKAPAPKPKALMEEDKGEVLASKIASRFKSLKEK